MRKQESMQILIIIECVNNAKTVSHFYHILPPKILLECYFFVINNQPPFLLCYENYSLVFCCIVNGKVQIFYIVETFLLLLVSFSIVYCQLFVGYIYHTLPLFFSLSLCLMEIKDCVEIFFFVADTLCLVTLSMLSIQIYSATKLHMYFLFSYSKS